MILPKEEVPYSFPICYKTLTFNEGDLPVVVGCVEDFGKGRLELTIGGYCLSRPNSPFVISTDNHPESLVVALYNGIKNIPEDNPDGTPVRDQINTIYQKLQREYSVTQNS